MAGLQPAKPIIDIFPSKLFEGKISMWVLKLSGKSSKYIWIQYPHYWHSPPPPLLPPGALLLLSMFRLLPAAQSKPSGQLSALVILLVARRTGATSVPVEASSPDILFQRPTATLCNSSDHLSSFGTLPREEPCRRALAAVS